MHEFKVKNNSLYCEGVRLQDVADKFSTPVYVYSYKTLIDHFNKIKKAFRQISPLICYSMKANSSLSLCKALVSKGAGLDIVSGGELFKALAVGCPRKKIVYASVGKTRKEIQDAIKAGILFFNAESLPEVNLINEVAGVLRKTADVALRINPNIEAKTHRYITTGKINVKFGIDMKTARNIFLSAAKFRHINLKGIHIHIGSQITDCDPFIQAVKTALKFIDDLGSCGFKIEYLNLGGGLGIIYSKEKPQTAEQFARRVVPLLSVRKLKFILEPGRFIVGNSGVLLTRVIYVKKTPVKRFVIVDAGMNDLLRPALYEAYHEILSADGKRSKLSKADVVGPICESADFLAKDRLLPQFKEGDIIAIMSAGAYGFSMSSNYNSRPQPAEVLVKGNKFYLIRERQSYKDLISKEKIINL